LSEESSGTNNESPSIKKEILGIEELRRWAGIEFKKIRERVEMLEDSVSTHILQRRTGQEWYLLENKD
jgi:hypothetical protein